MLRRIGLSLLSAAAVMSSATAADLTDYDGLKDGYPGVINWRGFYFGANAGYAWNGSNLLKNTLGNLVTEDGLTAEGAFGGLQAGYNWQRGRFVYGVEADIQGLDLTSSTTTSVPATAGSPSLSATSEAKTSLDWFGTVRGRLGAAVLTQGLIYATGGLAYGQTDQTLALTGYNAPAQHTTSSASRAVAAGYAVGGGFEYAFNRSWSFKTEYQYLDLGSVNVAQGFAIGGQAYSGSFAADRTYQTIRGAVNYHLSSPYEPLK